MLVTVKKMSISTINIVIEIIDFFIFIFQKNKNCKFLHNICLGSLDNINILKKNTNTNELHLQTSSKLQRNLPSCW